MNPQFLLVKPERATSPTTMALLFSTPARRRQPDSVDILGGVTPRKRVQAFFTPPGSVHVPLAHLSPCTPPPAPSCRPGHCWASRPAVQRHGLLHVCGGRVRPLLQMDPGTCARASMSPVCCRSCWLCILCTGASCYTTKRTEEVCIHNCLRTRDKFCPRRGWKREETQGMPAEGSRKRTGMSVCT